MNTPVEVTEDMKIEFNNDRNTEEKSSQNDAQDTKLSKSNQKASGKTLPKRLGNEHGTRSSRNRGKGIVLSSQRH